MLNKTFESNSIVGFYNKRQKEIWKIDLRDERALTSLGIITSLDHILVSIWS